MQNYLYITEGEQVSVATVAEISMKKTGLRFALFMGLLLPWTLLAWGLDDVIDWLSAQTAFGERREGRQIVQNLLLVPQDTLDMFLPLLQSLHHWMSAFAPGLIYWLGYMIWIFWGLGVFILLLLIAAGERVVNIIWFRFTRKVMRHK